MIEFKRVTEIAATADTVFDIALDIDAHVASMSDSHERAIAGVTRGIIGLGEIVTWHARHFGLPFTMTSRITHLERPRRFVDEQARGPFQSFRHEHVFEASALGTIMSDVVVFAAPLGPFGRIVEWLFLGRYVRKLIDQRNRFLKAAAEQRLIDHQEDAMPDRSEVALDQEGERRLAAQLFNLVWTLLERSDRTQAEDDEMLHAAHASRHHWGQVGEPVHWARGEWQCSRVYAVLRRGEPALHHARRCLELAETNDLGAFDIGCGHEAFARAYLVTGAADAAATHAAEGRTAADSIIEDEDREILLSDIADLQIN